MGTSQFGRFRHGDLGDLLQPLVAESRLGAPVEAIDAHGGHGAWPDAPAVRSVAAALERPAEAVLLGGGAILDAAPATDPAPLTSLTAVASVWLGAGRTAAATGAPLAWNAVGVPRDLGPELAALVRWLAGVSELVTVCDDAGRRRLAAVGVDAEVVPDPAHEAGRLWTARELEEARAGAPGRYVLATTAPVAGLAAAAHAAGALDAVLLVMPPGPSRPPARGAEGARAAAPASVREAVALVAGARLVISGDPGTLAVARGLGIPAMAAGTDERWDADVAAAPREPMDLAPLDRHWERVRAALDGPAREPDPAAPAYGDLLQLALEPVVAELCAAHDRRVAAVVAEREGARAERDRAADEIAVLREALTAQGAAVREARRDVDAALHELERPRLRPRRR